jgi:hypothetical protein
LRKTGAAIQHRAQMVIIQHHQYQCSGSSSVSSSHTALQRQRVDGAGAPAAEFAS